MDLLVGHQSGGVAKARVNGALHRRSHGHGRSSQQIPDAIDLITMSERDVNEDVDDYEMEEDNEEDDMPRYEGHSHHKTKHAAHKHGHEQHKQHHKMHKKHRHQQELEEDNDNEEFIQYDSGSHHRHKAHHKHQHHTAAPVKRHKRHHAQNFKSKGPSQIADVIEELQVEPEDAEDVDRRTPVKAPNPHLRDKLMKRRRGVESMPHAKKLRGDSHHGKKHRSHAEKHSPKKMPTDPGRSSEEDDVPMDEFGLKKDCHWIQMDFTQHSDNCNQCMSIADAYFRGDDICVCYHDKPGAPMRTKCNEIAAKFHADEEHIREIAVERQWNEYYKSYGLCEAYQHCGGGIS
jgi:hypothetical protein